MASNIDPVDYASPLARAAALVPDYATQQLQRQLGTLQTQDLAAQIKARNVETQQQQSALDQQAAYLRDVRGMGIPTATPPIAGDQAGAATQPAASSVSQAFALMLRNPAFSKQVKEAFDLQSKTQQQADLRQLGGAYSAARAGNVDLAAQTLKSRIDADKAAGQDTRIDQAIYDDLTSGDKARQGHAVDALQTAIAAAVGPDHFASTFGALGKRDEGFTLGQGQTRFGPDGKPIASVAPEQRYLVVPEGGAAIPITPGGLGVPTQPGGGGPASSGGGASTGGASRGDRNRNPGNIIDGPFARSQPGYVGGDGKFAIFSSPEAGVAAQERLLRGSYFAKGYDTVRKIIGRYAPLGDNDATGQSNYIKYVAGKIGLGPDDTIAPATLPALAQAMREFETGRRSSGGAQANAAQSGPTVGPNGVIYGRPKPKTRVLTPREAQAQGLDPSIVYQQSPEGSITPVGGQTRPNKTVRPLPETAIKRLQPSIDARDSLTRAVGTFKEAYGGHTMLGEWSNTAQSYLGDWSGVAPGQRQWWADFRATDNLIRNSLFGASLTANEKVAYDATTISPAMAPSIIKQNLAQREKIVRAALARQQGFLKVNGYDPDAVDALFGELGGGASPSQNIPRVRTLQEAMKLPKGTVFIDPYGKTRRR